MTPLGRKLAVGAAVVAAFILGLSIAWPPLEAAQAPPAAPQADVRPTAGPGEPTYPQVPQETDARSIRIDGREIVVGARDRVVVEHQDTVTDIGASSRTDRHAHTVGVGLETSADQVAQSFKAEAARTELDGVGAAAGGGFSYSGELTGGRKLNAFHTIGAALLAIALAFVVVPMLLKSPPRFGTAAAIGAGGIAFIAIGSSIESMPWAWAIAGVLILGLGGFWLFMAIRTGTITKTLQTETQRERGAVEALVTMVSMLDGPAKATAKSVLDGILTAWTPAERSEVQRVVADTKARLGL